MRLRKATLASATFLLLGACNAILGNEDSYRLGPAANEGGSAGGEDVEATSGQSGGGGKSSGNDAGSTSEGGNDANVGGAGASAGGGGGEPACDATATEDCFNGFDDDCNGEVDCEDAACVGPAECVSVPAGAELGSFPATAGACPNGTTAVVLHQGLTADPQCTGCSCAHKESFCDSSVVGLTCGQSTIGVSYNVFSNKCSPVTPANGASIRYYSVRGFTECTPQGTPSKSPVSWAGTSTFCQVERMGRGCGSGARCVAKTAAPACTITAGEQTCGGDYPVGTGEAWSRDYTDTRECSACQCGFGISTCGGGGSIELYSQPNCQGATLSLTGAAQGDNCNVGFTPASGRITGTPTGNTCPPNAYPSGELTPTDSSTICCK